MKTELQWIGPGTPKLFRLKAEAKGNHYTAWKVNCGLEGCLWARFDGNTILLRAQADGRGERWAIFHEARLVGVPKFTHVIGLRDLSTADLTAVAYRTPILATAWRHSLADLIDEEINRSA